jgi:hypothetical protein
MKDFGVEPLELVGLLRNMVGGDELRREEAKYWD